MVRIDEMGKRYGNLVVVGVSSNKRGEMRWVVRCDCGQEVLATGWALRAGKKTNCGVGACRNRWKVKDETGNRYGALLVLGREGSCYAGATWRCLCDCGNETVVAGSWLRSGNTKSCGCKKYGNHRLPDGVATINALFAGYKYEAEQRGYAWELTREQFEYLIQQPCYYCGKLAKDNERKRYKADNYCCNGIDRRNNNEGYLLENCVPCCSQCNFSKRNLSEEEFYFWIEEVYNHRIKSKRESFTSTDTGGLEGYYDLESGI